MLGRLSFDNQAVNYKKLLLKLAPHNQNCYTFWDMRLKSAFTLIELLVIILIIGTLATLAATSLKTATLKARDGRRISDINAMRKALELYKANNEIYPSESQFVVGAPLKVGNDTLLKIPNNPKSADGPCAINEYIYRQDNGGSSYHIYYCLGQKIQDAGPGPCIATPGHHCGACGSGSCANKCGGDNGCGQPCPTAACSSGYTCGLCQTYTCGQNRTAIPFVGGTSWVCGAASDTCNNLCQAAGFPGGYNALGSPVPYPAGWKPPCCSNGTCVNGGAFCGCNYIVDTSTCHCTQTCFNQP